MVQGEQKKVGQILGKVMKFSEKILLQKVRGVQYSTQNV